MGFNSVSENSKLERPYRDQLKGKLLQFGNTFLDDSLFGIRPDDLVLVGAPSGVGKTQFCVNVAIQNAKLGKRVHFFALEAGEFEIERRLKYQIIADNFYSNPNRPPLGRPLRFDEWCAGEFGKELEPYEAMAEGFCANSFSNLHTFYKAENFDIYKLIEHFSFIQDETDLIIVDHVHYFDWDDTNDNRAMKEIAKTARHLCLRAEKPMILVAHLRKRDKQNAELAAGLDEFHGSSDLTKIATKVISIAPGGIAENGGFITYFRTPKNRQSSSSSRYLGQMVFNEKKGGYEEEYKLGWANATKFGELEHSKRPSWVGRSKLLYQGGHSHSDHSGKPPPIETGRGIRNFAPGAENN